MLNKLFITASILLFLLLGWVGLSTHVAPLKTAVPGLLAAFGLGAWLGWTLKSEFVVRRITNLEEAWAARLQDKETELELTRSKLGSFLIALQTDYTAAVATIRTHEAALAECQAKLDDLATGLAARTGELERNNEALSHAAQEWETKYHAVVQEKEAEIGRLQSRVRELEPFTVRAQEWERKFLLVSGDKDAQINQLLQQLRELERLRRQSKHWMFSVLLQEREGTPARLTPLHFRP